MYVNIWPLISIIARLRTKEFLCKLIINLSAFLRACAWIIDIEEIESSMSMACTYNFAEPVYQGFLKGFTAIFVSVHISPKFALTIQLLLQDGTLPELSIL